MRNTCQLGFFVLQEQQQQQQKAKIKLQKKPTIPICLSSFVSLNYVSRSFNAHFTEMLQTDDKNEKLHIQKVND